MNLEKVQELYKKSVEPLTSNDAWTWEQAFAKCIVEDCISQLEKEMDNWDVNSDCWNLLKSEINFMRKRYGI